ncbi:hypothetical protein KAX02_04205 [candidate division WOR-3 bacterium]|nr:hypothetical protein [candidate division WOR-3 bacterium]
MKLNFINTGYYFPYLYYLAIVSAKKAHSVDEVVLWTTTEIKDNHYFELLKERVKIKSPEIPPIPNLHRAKERYHGVNTERVRIVVLADILRWKILYEEGGIYLDLDTFSLRNMTLCLGNKEVWIPFERPEGWSTSENVFAIHAIMSKPGSEIIKSAYDYAIKRMKLNFGTIRWTETGNQAMEHAIRRANPSNIEIGSRDLFIPFTIWEQGFWDRADLPLNPDAYLLHLNATLNENIVKDITPEWIKHSNGLYARLVKEKLDEEEWCI